MTQLFLLRHFCCEKREEQVSWVTDIIRMKVRPALALWSASSPGPASNEWSPLRLKERGKFPSLRHGNLHQLVTLPPPLARWSRNGQRNVKFSRSLGADINRIWWKSCENEAEAAITITLWRLAPRYG